MPKKYSALAAGDDSGKVLMLNSPLLKPSRLKVAHGLGMLAEKIVVPAKPCTKRPDFVSRVEAAGVSLVGLTPLETTVAV